MAEVIDMVDGYCGVLALRAAGEHFEVIADGVFLMDTRGGQSERLLVTAPADELAAEGPAELAAAGRACGARVLIGGLGVGFSVRAALEHPAVGEVVVVEREPAVVRWNARGPLRHVHGDVLADPRVRLVEADLMDWLAGTAEVFEAACVDIDNGPRWTLSERNARLYTEAGLALLSQALDDGGLLSVWGAEPDPRFTARLGSQFAAVRTHEVPVRRGAPDVVWVARHAGAPQRPAELPDHVQARTLGCTGSHKSR